jgi:hypothetical protein
MSDDLATYSTRVWRLNQSFLIGDGRVKDGIGGRVNFTVSSGATEFIEQDKIAADAPGTPGGQALSTRPRFGPAIKPLLIQFALRNEALIDRVGRGREDADQGLRVIDALDPGDRGVRIIDGGVARACTVVDPAVFVAGRV